MKKLLCLVAFCSVSSFGERIAIAERKVELAVDFSYQPIPRFHNGFLVAKDISRTRVRMFDLSGTPLLDTAIVVPQATHVSIADIAVKPDRTSAVAASLGGSAAIVWLKPDGQTIRIVPTPSFSANRVVFAPNGNLWALGRAYTSTYENEKEYDVLREYDANGQLIRTALPRSTFAIAKGNPSEDSLLAVSKDRLIVVSMTAGECVELSFHGEVLQRWPLPVHGMLVSGVAVSESNDLLLTGQLENSIELYRYDKPSRSLAIVDTTRVRSPNQGLMLLGSESGTLVARMKPPGSVVWFRIE